MRVLKFLIEKEFKQIFRNPIVPKIIFMMPMMMMLVFPWAANMEVKDINLSIVDNDHSPYSERLIQKTVSSGYFRLTDVSATNELALQSIESNDADIILEIEKDFEKNLVKNGAASVMISANAVNSTRGGLGASYMGSIIGNFAEEIRNENIQSQSMAVLPVIRITTQNRFNPYLNYKVFMVPALMVMLLTMLSGFLPALNIVSEKEIGTIEQMNVTPVGKFSFILAKLLPYWLIGFLVLTICFGLAALAYGLIPVGSLATIYLFAGIYILVVSGFGLVISNYSSTMQQAMLVMYFFMMILILLSGLFTPINSMPDWAQMITRFNPLRYFIEVMRMIYLKGSSFTDLSTQAIALCGFAVFFNVWAIWSYRKSS